MVEKKKTSKKDESVEDKEAKETEEKVKTTEEKEEAKEEKIEKTKEEKLKEIKEKAAKLSEKIEVKDEQILEKVRAAKAAKKAKRDEGTLFPLEDYVKYSAHLGTKAVTPHMRVFVYKRRADGIAVLNTNQIDEYLKKAIEYLITFEPENIFIACKREAGWDATKKFSEVTGIKAFTKKYPAGVITNTTLAEFFETELVIICDPWLDKNVLNDAIRIKKPIISLCDTNNLTTGVTKIIPCNNKSPKSIGLILYLIAREYLKAKAIKKELNIVDFAGEVDTMERGERERKKGGAKEGV